MPGKYFVHIPSSEFTTGGHLIGLISSTDTAAKDETKDENADENGLDATSIATAPITAGVTSNVFDLTVGFEPQADDETAYTGYLDNANVNYTADFGFLAKVALGNIVWLDNGAGTGGIANNGKQDGTEPGIPNVDLALYHVGDTPGMTPPVATTSTNPSGYYVFDNLQPGQYFVFIPGTEFGTGQPLVNLLSSTGAGSDESTDQTGDENGIDNATPITNGISSTEFDLQPTLEQTGEPQPNYTGALDDDNVNFTADFGFTELVAIGNRIWLDTGVGAFYNDGMRGWRHR